MVQSKVRVGGNVRRLRVSAGLSLDDLAADAAVGRAWLSRLETGLQNANLDTVDRLADALGVDPAALFVPVHDDTGSMPRTLRAGRKPTRSPVQGKRTRSG
ncbi:MAG: helix-turn-helix transcriptional regulator [Alphaproteobacteria bacterium]|nr:helix-turn-helix transcriptional regulator [Alphaproteobacteria bacterium]